MEKGIPYEVTRMLHNICVEKSNELQRVPGSAGNQLAIRQVPNIIKEYAMDVKTDPGVVEVIFADKPFRELEDLRLQLPTSITFRNFTDIDNVSKNSLLIKHTIVVVNWSNNLKVFKATMDNESMHLMLYSIYKT